MSEDDHSCGEAGQARLIAELSDGDVAGGPIADRDHLVLEASAVRAVRKRRTQREGRYVRHRIIGKRRALAVESDGIVNAEIAARALS
jgi:hypothetical protein